MRIDCEQEGRGDLLSVIFSVAFIGLVLRFCVLDRKNVQIKKKDVDYWSRCLTFSRTHVLRTEASAHGYTTYIRV